MPGEISAEAQVYIAGLRAQVCRAMGWDDAEMTRRVALIREIFDFDHDEDAVTLLWSLAGLKMTEGG